VGDRIDLLALGRDGEVIVIELKHGNDKLQLLQAISYAGMIAKWKPEELLTLAKTTLGIDKANSIINDWLADDSVAVNSTQRILLIAEAFDYEVLVGAEWLYQEGKGAEIDCVRVTLAVDGATEYLTFAQVFPNPELAEQARLRGTRPTREVAYESWDEAYKDSQNSAAVEFFKKHVVASCDSKVQERLIVLSSGSHKFRIRLRGKHARATQVGRFLDDITFWTNRLTPPAKVYEGYKAGSPDVLRFFLRTPEDFAAFEHALAGDVLTAEWENSQEETFA
jgi:hypothetical protein